MADDTQERHQSRKRTLQVKFDSNGNTPRSQSPGEIDRESQVTPPKQRHLFFRFYYPLFLVIRLLGPSACDIFWQCYIQYVELYPLSSSARVLRATTFRWTLFVIGENFLMVFCVGYNVFSFWSFFKHKVPHLVGTREAVSHRPFKKWLNTLVASTCNLICGIVLIVFITVPFWWRGWAWGTWRRTAWNDEVCDGWDYMITMNAVDYREIMFRGADDPAILSRATLWGTRGLRHSIELEHMAVNLSKVTVLPDNRASLPETFTIEYNYTDLSYYGSKVSGTYNDFPVLSFPDLSLSSGYPNYTRSWGCDAPATVLVDSEMQEVIRTTVANYDDCTMLKVCGRGSLDQMAAPLGVILIELEKSGLCCTSPFVKRPSKIEPNTKPFSTTCTSVSQFIGAIEDGIQSNPDISGIGIRLTIYTQALLNNLVAMSSHTLEEAIAINSANALAIAAFSLASGFARHLDWPHLILVYHFVLLVKFSGVSYNTAPIKLRRSPEFSPLMDHLAILDLMVMPFFIMISGTLWLGVWLARERFAQTQCALGNWVLFGKNVNLKTGKLVLVGGALAIVLVGWSVFCTVVDMVRRQATVARTAKVMEEMYGNERPTSPRPLPPQVNIELTGDYCSPLLWRLANCVIGKEMRICGYVFGVREVVFFWRFLVWAYLIVASEQTFALLLVFVPVGVLWSGCYRKFPRFAKFLDSRHGHRIVWYTSGTMLSLAYTAAIYALNEDACVQRTVWSIAIVCCILPEYVRRHCSKRFDELFGNHTSPGSSYWEVWTSQLQLRLPRFSGEDKQLEQLDTREAGKVGVADEEAITCTKKES